MAIFDDLKSAASVLQEAGKIEQYRQILEVQKQLLEMQKHAADLEIENKDLKEKLQTHQGLIYENNAYWTQEEDKKVGPFCSRCWDVDKKLIRMHPDTNRAFSKCPKCGTAVQIDPSYEPTYSASPMPPTYDL